MATQQLPTPGAVLTDGNGTVVHTEYRDGALVLGMQDSRTRRVLEDILLELQLISTMLMGENDGSNNGS